MTFPPGFHSMPYSWQMGYIAGLWKPTDKDKQPPENEIVKDTQAWRDWNEGFKVAKQRDQKP